MSYKIKRIIRRIKNLPKFIKDSIIWEFESCKECGSLFRVMWHVDDEIWKKVMNVDNDSGGSLCVDCFVRKAEKIGYRIKPEEIRIDIFYPE